MFTVAYYWEMRFVKEIRQILSLDWQVRCYHIYREANGGVGRFYGQSSLQDDVPSFGSLRSTSCPHLLVDNVLLVSTPRIISFKHLYITIIIF